MMRNAGESCVSPLRFCGVMKAWKADVSLLRRGDSKPLRSPRGDCKGKKAHVRSGLNSIAGTDIETLHRPLILPTYSSEHTAMQDTWGHGLGTQMLSNVMTR